MLQPRFGEEYAGARDAGGHSARSLADLRTRGRRREAAEVQHDRVAVLGPGDHVFLYFLSSGRCLRFRRLMECRFSEDIDELIRF